MVMSYEVELRGSRYEDALRFPCTSSVRSKDNMEKFGSQVFFEDIFEKIGKLRKIDNHVEKWYDHFITIPFIERRSMIWKV